MAQLGQGDEILKLFKRERGSRCQGSFIIGFATVVLHNNPSLSGDKFIHLGKRLLCP